MHFRMSQDIIKPQKNELRQVNPILFSDKRYYPFFSTCIGALDGTHVSVRVGSHKKEKYWNLWKQHPTMNVLAICNFNMEFIFTYMGTPGRAHDSKILTYCAQNDEYFPTAPEEKYFLVDSSYPNRKGYLAATPSLTILPIMHLVSPFLEICFIFLCFDFGDI